MELIQEIIIDKPIADCWEVLGNQFTDIHKWASPVNHAVGDGKTGVNGAACDIRGCNISGMGDITEKVTDFDPQNHYLAYDIISGLPAMMKSAKNTWQLIALSESRTKVNMKGTVAPNGMMGRLMKPMMKIKFGKMTRDMLGELKYYVENGQPHDRKIKAAKKFAA